MDLVHNATLAAVTLRSVKGVEARTGERRCLPSSVEVGQDGDIAQAAEEELQELMSATRDLFAFSMHEHACSENARRR